MGAVHVRTPKNFVLEERLRLRRTPKSMPEIGARPVRQLAASLSNIFTWISVVARERTL